jgi:hypothetical protein
LLEMLLACGPSQTINAPDPVRFARAAVR